MKAVTRTKYGTSEVLEVREISRPSPKKREVLIRVYATTVNRTDCGILQGKPLLIRAFTGLFKPKSPVPGTDFAGEIVGLGEQVTRFNVGDRVWGLRDEGLASQAEYMTFKEDAAIAIIPHNFNYKEAAASAEGAHYAYNFINKVSLTRDSKVLVYGATGAIGIAAVQLLKHYKTYVTAVGNTKNMNLVESLGADKLWNYETEDFTTDEEKYDFIFDAVGKSSFGACKSLLKKNGIYISSELGPKNENLYLPILTKIKGGKRVIFPIPSNWKRTIQFMSELIASGEFKAVIDREYEMDEIKEAYEYVASGEKTGNVVVTY